jgi:hypothetical protein
MGASSSDSAQLLLSIDASTEILRSEVARATATIDKLEHETGKRLDEVKEHFVKLGEKVRETATEFARLGAEILIGQSIKSAIERAIEYSETLNKTAAQLGVTTTFLQEFRFAATNSAVSAEAADKSLAKYSVTLGRAADGNKTAAKAFADIGVKIADTSGNLRPAEAIFRDVADAVKSMKSPAEQAAAAVAIFGRGSQSLLPILQEGAEGFDHMADKAKKMGLVLGEGTIDRLEELSNATKNVKAQISTQLAQIIGDNAEALMNFGRNALWAAEKLGHLFDMARGAAFLLHQGRPFDFMFMSGEDQAKIGTPSGQVDDAWQRVRDARAKVAGYETPGLINSSGLGKVRLADARAELQTRQEDLQLARDRLLTLNNPVNMFHAQKSDNGVTGGKVKPVDDPDGRRVADEAARQAERIAVAAERRLVTLKDEVGALDASIVEAQSKLAPTAETKLAADLAGEQAKINALVAKAKIAAGDDTTDAQHHERAAQVADLKALGAVRLATIQDQYDREHAAALASIEDSSAQQLLAARASSASLIKDDDERAAAEKAIALDQADFEIAQIQREIDASNRLDNAERAALGRKQDAVRANRDVQLQGIDRNHEGPLQGYIDSLPDTAAKANKAFQSAAVDGLKAFDDGLTGLITGTENLSAAVKHMATAIIADLARILIEKAIIGPLAGALGLGSAFGGGFADGGVPPAGKVSLVGENGPELIVGNGSARVIPFKPGPMSATAGGGGSTQQNNINIDAHGASDPAEIDRRVRAGILAVVPALHAGIRDSTIAQLKRPMLPGGRS